MKKTMNKMSALQREPRGNTRQIGDIDFRKSPAMYLFNVWFIMIYFVYSQILKINTKTDDKVALNKAKLKELNIKREISCILKNILYLWQRNDQIYCSAN